MRGIILLANGFEETEAIATIDYLRRSGLKLDMISLQSIELVGQNGIQIKADYLLEEVFLPNYDYLIIPGGKAVMAYHLDSLKTRQVVNYFMNKKSVVACICAAPMILGILGFLKSKSFTCFPGCEGNHYDGVYISNKKVVVDGSIITSQGMGTTIDFSEAIVTKLLGCEVSRNTSNRILYSKDEK